jgi:hypothetical protein
MTESPDSVLADGSDVPAPPMQTAYPQGMPPKMLGIDEGLLQGMTEIGEMRDTRPCDAGQEGNGMGNNLALQVARIAVLLVQVGSFEQRRSGREPVNG